MFKKKVGTLEGLKGNERVKWRTFKRQLDNYEILTCFYCLLSNAFFLIICA